MSKYILRENNYSLKQNIMKQAVYIIGVIAGLAIVIGFLFKAQHWPGAGVVLSLSTLTSIIFIPLFAVSQYKKDKN